MKPRAGAVTLACAIALSGIGAPGCYLYKGSRYDLAVEARDAFTEADLAASIEAERELLAETLERELQMVRRQTLARRDAVLIAIIGGEDAASSWRYAESQISERLLEIGGGDSSAVESLALIPVLEDRMNLHARTYRAAKAPDDPEPHCPVDPQIDTSGMSAIAKLTFEQFQRACERYRESVSRLGVDAEVEALQSWQARIAERVRKIRRAHQELRARIEQAAPEDRVDAAAELAAVKEALAAELAPITDVAFLARDLADSIGVAPIILEELALQERLAELEEVRRAVNDLVRYIVDREGDPPVAVPDEIKLRLELVRSIPDFAQQLERGFNTSPVTALVLEAERLRIEREGIAARIARAERRIELLRLKRKAVAVELMNLMKARQELGAAKEALGFERSEGWPAGEAPLHEDYGKKSAARPHAGAMLLALADSWTQGRAAQEQIDYLLIGLSHEAALDGAATALAQWENLIGVPLGQLVAVHEGGIRSEQITNLLHALGLSAIAVGVNTD